MKELSLRKRILWVLAAVAIQFVYFPTSQLIEGGIAPRLSIDVIPVYPIWAVPYFLCYPLWLFGILWAIMKLDDHSFRALIASALFTFAIAITIFIFFPTYVILPYVPGNDVFSVMLRWVQVAGGTHDALPSAHNYITMLMTSFAIRLYPRQRLVWIAVVIVVALSTLFTGQHYIPDVVAGWGLGWIGYKFGWWFVGGK